MMTAPISKHNGCYLTHPPQVEENKQETSLVPFIQPDTIDPVELEEALSFDSFKNWAYSTASSLFEGVKSLWPQKKETKKSGIQFREPLDCTVYENALKCLGLTEEEARDKDVLERRYQATYTHEKERRDWFREKKHGPLLKFAEMKLHEKHVSYRTILARHHNEM